MTAALEFYHCSIFTCRGDQWLAFSIFYPYPLWIFLVFQSRLLCFVFPSLSHYSILLKLNIDFEHTKILSHFLANLHDLQFTIVFFPLTHLAYISWLLTEFLKKKSGVTIPIFIIAYWNFPVYFNFKMYLFF